MAEVLHINFYARKAVKEFMEEVEKYNPEMSWDNVYLGIVDGRVSSVIMTYGDDEVDGLKEIDPDILQENIFYNIIRGRVALMVDMVNDID